MAAGLISASQIEIALREQELHGMRIGEILALHNWIKQETADFFVEILPSLLRQEQKKPLVYYFKQAGLLSEEQVNKILRLQKQKGTKVRFHRLAVEQGYLKQLTVDFFLSNLFKIYNPNNFSFTNIYTLLRSFNQGETSFQSIQLKKAPLLGVSLKEIQLNGSNLKQANLQGSNLKDSSLVQVNFALANLTKAILTNANLERACLSHANLQESHLGQANFRGANLRNANLKNAYLFHASFIDADLSEAILDSNYSYEVYYNRKTIFPSGFDPKSAGWKVKRTTDALN